MKKLITAIVVLVLLLFVTLQPKPEPQTKYSVVFFSNGGTNVQTIQTYSNMTIYPPQNPTRSSSDFEGWFTSLEFKEEDRFDFNTKITKSITLYAKWEASQYEIIYDLGDGDWPSEEIKAMYVTVLNFESNIVYFKFQSNQSPVHPGGRANSFTGWRTISQADYNLLSAQEKAEYPYIERIRPKEDDLDDLFDESSNLVLYAHYRNIN